MGGNKIAPGGDKNPRIPEEIRRRNPMINPAGYHLLLALRESEVAPRWNYSAGDRLTREDVVALREWHRVQSRDRHPPFGPEGAGNRIRSWIAGVIGDIPFFKKLPFIKEFDFDRDWPQIPTTHREDIARHPEELIPLSQPLEEMIAYRTAGTTGHAITVPHAYRAIGAYQPLTEIALARYGIELEFRPDRVASFLVGCQRRTFTYPTVLSLWNNAGFAKINLQPDEWNDPAHPQEFFSRWTPSILSGDPISFSEMMGQGIKTAPRAMLTTAVAMSQGLKARLENYYRCPVIEWYSLIETGPLAYVCARGNGCYHLLSDDVFLEALDATGTPVAPGERGEIAVTGGRNPFLPLIRYRTGDWGRLDFSPCPCGDPMPKILDLEGRKPVMFRTPEGRVVNPVDISRVLREFPLVQHEFRQGRNMGCHLTIRPIDPHRELSGEIKSALTELFGPNVPIEIDVDPELGNRPEKVIPYQSDFLLE